MANASPTTTPSVLDSLVQPWPTWALILVVLVLVLLAVSLVWLVQRRRKAARGIPQADAATAAPGVAKGALVQLWEEFVGRLPWEVRRYLGELQPFVVLGEAGSGKSRLISVCTDWQAQADQLHPSHVTSPLIQFYLSSRALVLEMASALLVDTRMEAHRALEQLGRRLPRTRVPHVVLAVNGATLANRDPESLHRLAGHMRGKINLLAKTAGRPLQVSLALTHMDQVSGYRQWSAFLEREGLPFQATWDDHEPHPSVETALERYEVLLSKALISVATPDFMAMVAFLKESGTWLSVADRFVRILQANDAFSPPPRVVRLTLHGLGETPPLAQPFQATALAAVAHRWSPVRRHQLTAASILGLGGLVLGSLFVHQHTTLKKLDARMDAMELVRPASYDDLHALFPKTNSQGLHFSPVPVFFPAAEKILVSRLTEAIRRHYLYPELERLRSLADANEPVIYLLGLLYATPRNGLSTMILAQPQDWADPLHLPPRLVVDYATHNIDRPEIAMDAGALRLGPTSFWEPIQDQVGWGFLLRRLEAVSGEPFLTPEMLKELQATAAPLLRMVQRIFSYPHLTAIVEHLKQIAPFGGDIQWLQRREALARQQQLVDLIKAVATATLEHTKVSNLSLTSFLKLVGSMSPVAGTGQAPLTLTVGDRNFTVSLKDWRNLVIRSQMTLMMREFIAANQQNRGFIFFDGPNEFPDIWLNGSNDGTLFFTGQARIDGRFTREAFIKRVRPAVEEMEDRLKGLPVFPEEGERFRQAVRRHLEWYADRYAESYRQYWGQFRVNADSETTLRFVLNRIFDLSSPLFDFLLTVHANTMLDTSGPSLLRPLGQRLEMFKFVHTLMQQKDGMCPEWEKYKALIGQMKDDLDSEPKVKPAGGKDEDTAAFKVFLSPLGRISYAMQVEESGSYLNLCRQWLKSAGIGPEWQGPFLDPFRWAYVLGKSEIESSIAFVWADLNREYVEPMRGRFPFYPGGQEEIAPQELERLLGPQGNFWQSFRLYLAPVCKETNGVWVERIAPQGVIALPRGMLAAANSLTRITRTLWDEKGAAKPLVYSLQPPPLPAGQDPAQVPVLCYLRLGANSVMAFNQQPAWQELKVDWWKAEPAAVGMAFESPESHEKMHRELPVERGYWSFYRLLAKGQGIDPSTLAWSLDGPKGGTPLSLVYRFSTDPWALFRLPDPGPALTRTTESRTETRDPTAGAREAERPAKAAFNPQQFQEILVLPKRPQQPGELSR